MQGQTHMLTQQNWAAPSSNAAIDQWMSMTSNVNAVLDNMHDFQDPLNLPNSTGYVPPPAHLDWSL
jgi:hypothetical protein